MLQRLNDVNGPPAQFVKPIAGMKTSIDKLVAQEKSGFD
jgi:hypothetical protein